MTKNTKTSLDKYITKWYGWIGSEISRNIAKGRMSEYSGDLLHHQISEVYKMDDEKIVQMVEDDKLRWYILTSAGFSLRSSTSPFYRIYRREKMNSRENFTDGGGEHSNHMGLGILDKVYEPYEGDPLYLCYLEQMEKLHWYLRTLMNEYWLNGKTLTDLYKHYNISKTHLIRDLNTAMTQIREGCKHC